MLTTEAIEEQVKSDLEKAGIKTEPVSVSKDSSEKELTPFEMEQQKKGWKPGGRKSAEEWAENEPLAAELRAMRNENKKYQETINQLKVYVDKQEEIAYKKAIQELSQQRAAAIERGDVETVDRLDEEKKNMEPQRLNEEPVHPAVADFYARNDSWISGTSFDEVEMLAYAQERDRVIKQKNLPPEQHMKLLEECVVKKFPDYFQKGGDTEEYVAAPLVESSGYKTSNKKKKYSRSDLNTEQLEVLKNFELFKVMDEAAYIDGLVKSGELK